MSKSHELGVGMIFWSGFGISGFDLLCGRTCISLCRMAVLLYEYGHGGGYLARLGGVEVKIRTT